MWLNQPGNKTKTMNNLNLEEQLKKFANSERKRTNKSFFKTGKGEYGEGDEFLGVCVPDNRKVAGKNVDANFTYLQQNIKSKFHEVRLCVVLILVEKNKIALKNKDKKVQKQIVNFYLRNLKYVNNWDLVDSSAPHILGQAILDKIKTKNILDDLIKSRNMWKRRVGIIATLQFIKTGEIKSTLQLSKKLLSDEEDLMHKAIGWMLRESWKKDSEAVENFLVENYENLPRTTLRYAIERLEESKRKKFLKGIFS